MAPLGLLLAPNRPTGDELARALVAEVAQRRNSRPAEGRQPYLSVQELLANPSQLAHALAGGTNATFGHTAVPGGPFTYPGIMIPGDA